MLCNTALTPYLAVPGNSEVWSTASIFNCFTESNAVLRSLPTSRMPRGRRTVVNIYGGQFTDIQGHQTTTNVTINSPDICEWCRTCPCLSASDHLNPAAPFDTMEGHTAIANAGLKSSDRVSIRLDGTRAEDADCGVANLSKGKGVSTTKTPVPLTVPQS